MVGFDKVQVYDMVASDFGKPLEPWVQKGLVEYHEKWARGTLLRTSIHPNPARKEVCCSQAFSHDHCMLTNSLTSAWVAVAHGPDFFVLPNLTQYPRGMKDLLASYAGDKYAELSYQQRRCVLSPENHATTTQLGGHICEPQEEKLWKQYLPFPIMNPRMVHNTFVHFSISHHAGVEFPQTLLNCSSIVGLHLMNTYSDRMNASEFERSGLEPILRDVIRPRVGEIAEGVFGKPSI